VLVRVRATMPALFVALLSSGCALAQSNPPAPAPTKSGQEQKAKTNGAANEPKAAQGESKNSPLPVTIDSPVTIQKSKQDRDAETSDSEQKTANDRWLIVWTGILACTTLLLAGITAVLARYTYKLWYDASKTSERQALEMQNSLRIANDATWAAQDSARAAKRTVNIMTDTAARQLRAYVFEHADTDNTKVCPEGWVVDVEIRNAGQTPAYDVRCASTLRPLIDPLPKDFEFSPSVFDEGTFVVNPGIPRANSVKTELMSPSDRAAVKNGDKVLYLWGRIEYVDVFERPHFGEYRLRFQVEVRGDNIFGQWVYCAQGNDVDRRKQS
jgi:hypothetical protein